MGENIKKRMTIQNRLRLIEIVSVLGMILIALVAILTSDRINQASTVIADYWMPAVIATEEWKTETSNYRIAEYNHALSEDAAEMERLDGEIRQYQENLTQAIADYGQKYVGTVPEREAYDSVQALWQQYLVHSEAVLKSSREGRQQEALKLLSGDYQEIFKEINSSLSGMAQEKQQAAESASEGGNQLFRRLIEWKVILILALTIALSALVVSLIRGIVVPLEKVVRGVQSVAAGTLSVRLECEGDKEIQDMATAVNGLAESLKTMADDEKRVLQEIGQGNLDAASYADSAYRGDFAAILYEMEGLKTRLKEKQEEAPKENG